MDLEKFKTWHWAMIGLVLGGMWAGSRLMYAPEADGARTMNNSFFYLLMANSKWPRGERMGFEYEYLTGLQVHPAFVPDAKTEVLARNMSPDAGNFSRVQWVTGTLHVQEPERDARGRPKFSWFAPVGLHDVRAETFHFLAPLPFTPSPKSDAVTVDDPRKDLKKAPNYKPPASNQYADVRGYFDEINRKYGAGTVSYRYAWWEARAAIAMIYPLAGLVVVGGVWPAMLALMLGAGLGRKRDKAEVYDLSRFKGASKANVLKASSVMTDADKAHLATLEAEMEKRLDGFGEESKPAAAPAGSPTVAVAAAPRALSTETAGAPTKADVPKPAKAFGAEQADYYPTEIHGARKDSQG